MRVKNSAAPWTDSKMRIITLAALMFYVTVVYGKRGCPALRIPNTTSVCNKQPRNDGKYPQNTVCTFACNAGCEEGGGSSRRRCMGRRRRTKWHGRNLRCQCNPCNSAPSHPDGYTSNCAVQATYPAGYTCSFTCPAGYVQVGGQAEKLCVNGRWVGNDLLCEQTMTTTPNSAEMMTTTPPITVDEYTSTLTGCQCWFNTSRWDCACCRPDGCQCWSDQPHRCIPCGTDCGDYPAVPWAVANNGVAQHVASSCPQCVWTVMAMFQPVSVPSIGFVTNTYSPSDEDLVNPERGWWKYAATEDEGFEVLTVSQLSTFRSEGHTLIFRYYVLDLFVHSDISAEFLTNLQADLQNARAAGVKIVPRFAYTLTEGITADAPLPQALSHVAQLKPYLQAYGDVIAVVQAGFVGTWGEWYYSDSYSSPDIENDGEPVLVTDDDWANRRTLLEAILDAVPNERMVQIRYMKYKRRFTGDDSPLTESEARSGSEKARIGHHNDCFLASDYDWGTFEDLPVDYAYLSADTKYTVMGGETCNYNPPRSSCAKAEEELALFHWSYLNPYFHPDITGEWKQQGCYDRIGLHLGYRLELVSGTYRSAVPQGGTFCGRLEIRNVGYAAPFNPRDVRIVLQQDSVIVTSLLVTGVDPRDWHPGTLHSVPISVQLPSNVSPGSYQVFLWLSDPSPTISDRAEFSILLANTGVPDPLTGLNNLGHTLQEMMVENSIL
ncbi:PREDICTED: uncharacterized protein LOC109484404 [Branchiostoma belcheri]|uniref:Uncharacterized protein LOC109484404 n=1 Tax=Branchiostoma belcheri TaxID=7741 RepID=A0A6P5AMG7_BRABE|nr:PREDICTED: uncharacterized protein LOC109484404 [Branchiostoma belcheri]